MTVRPRLIRSIPFWILLALSLVSAAVGAWLVVDRITVMDATLTDGTATGVEVYGGQSWVVVGAALLGAGIVGLVAVLFLATLRAFVAPAPVAVVEPIAWSAASELEVVEETVAVEEVAAPVSAEEPESVPAAPTR